MNKISVFNFKSKEIRSVLINDEPWFVAQDICEALGLDGTSAAVSRLDSDEKSKNSIRTLGGMQEVSVISKAGLFQLILTSRKVGANDAKKEILSQISDASSVLKALNDFEVPDDLPDMYVYAIRNTVTGNVKLGISRDPQTRLKQLQTGNDCKLELVATRRAENRFSDEIALHNKYSELRIQGEWFSGQVSLS